MPRSSVPQRRDGVAAAQFTEQEAGLSEVDEFWRRTSAARVQSFGLVAKDIFIPQVRRRREGRGFVRQASTPYVARATVKI